jgi:hypothetical protein
MYFDDFARLSLPLLYASDSIPALMAFLVSSVMLTSFSLAPFWKSAAVRGGPQTKHLRGFHQLLFDLVICIVQE